MDDRLATDIRTLIDRANKDTFETGFREGRLAEREQLRAYLDTAFSIAQPRRRRRAAEGEATTVNDIAPLVRGALRELEEESGGHGVLPDTIVHHLQTNPPSGNGLNIGSRQVRQALRLLTMQGEARRMHRGRYLPAEHFNLQP